METKRYRVSQMDDVPPVPCPCGQSRRSFVGDGNEAATAHLVDISADSRAHYHRHLTEIYVVLEGEGVLEADGDRVPLRPMTSVMIHPGCVHRAVGRLKVLVIALPAFDPADEFEVEG
jgi:mannose-6-phosphate isomerase-like protein (cupin superfamily)